MRLSTLYPNLTTEQRAALADKAGTEPGYLWQLATRWRGKKPSLAFLAKLAAADDRLTLADMVEEFADRAPVPTGDAVGVSGGVHGAAVSPTPDEAATIQTAEARTQ